MSTHIPETGEFHIIQKSNITGAGTGAFAIRDIEQDTEVGTYGGKRLTKEEWLSLDNKDYIFHVTGAVDEEDVYIDGGNGGNWLSKINGIKNGDEKINLICFQRNGNIHFKTITSITKGDEFIIDYGNSYWDTDLNDTKNNKNIKNIQCGRKSDTGKSREKIPVTVHANSRSGVRRKSVQTVQPNNREDRYVLITTYIDIMLQDVLVLLNNTLNDLYNKSK